MDKDWRSLSRRLYKVLGHVGASENVRTMHKLSSKIGEILDTVKLTVQSNRSVRSYRCGSSFEGSVTPATSSDIDIVYGVDQVFPLVANLDRAPGSLSLYMCRSDSTYPGYVKLRLLLDGRPITLADKDYLNGFDVDIDGHFCFKHLSTGENAMANGPADAIYDKHGKHVFDNVFSFKCSDIPGFARGWIDHWTSKGGYSGEAVSELGKMGCMVVGVGNLNSQERNIEWRLSFTLQERQLMSNLNPVQHKVYILLKIIKEEFLNKAAVCEKITSYHCKTCVLYATSISPAHAWRRDNLTGCLFTCLSILLKMVGSKFCPNFFVKDQNLFAKKGFRIQQAPLAKLLQSLLHEGPGFLFSIQTEQIGQRLLYNGVQLRVDIANGVSLFKFKHKLRDIGAIMYCRRLMLKSSDSTELHRLFADMDDFRNSERLSDKAEDDILRVQSYLSPYLHLHCAMRLSARVVTPGQVSNPRMLLKICEDHLQRSVRTDLLSSWLIRATLMMIFQKYEECLRLLQRLEDRCDRYVLSLCSCTGNPSNDDPVPENVQQRLSGLSLEDILQNHVATCIVLRPSEFAITPWPLRFEMFKSVGTPRGSRDVDLHYWYDLVVVDAKVYLYLMVYIVSSRLDRRLHRHAAIVSLRKLVARDSGLWHKDTALNLLGWMYVQEDQILEGLRCFAQSWRLQPGHNAAKFHVMSVWDRVKSLGIK